MNFSKTRDNDRGNESRSWVCKVRLITNETRTLRNTTARTFEEAKRKFSQWTDFKEFIVEPYIAQ